MKNRPIYYDTETTGLSPENDRIIEIAAYDPYLDRSFNCLVNPKMKIPEESIAICGITDDMVKDSPSFDVVGEDFIKFCHGECILIAHNNDAFDIRFLKNEFKRNNLEMPSWRFIDTLKWARKYRTDLPRHSLQYLRQIYAVEENNAHRALDDVIVLEKVFSKMIDDLSLDTVYKLLREDAKIVRMPFGKHQGKSLSDVPKSYVNWLKENGVFEKEENKNLEKQFVELGVINK